MYLNLIQAEINYNFLHYYSLRYQILILIPVVSNEPSFLKTPLVS